MIYNCYLPLDCAGQRFLSYLKRMYVLTPIKFIFYWKKIIIKQVFYDLFSDLMIKCWQANVDAAVFKRRTWYPKSMVNWGKQQIRLGGM